MAEKDDIRRFLTFRSVAVVGASRDRDKYGNIVYRRLRDLGIRVFAVNPNADRVEGDPSYPSLDRLPENVEGAVIVVPPEETDLAVRDAAAAGIRSIWMQPGAGSQDAIRFCEASGMCVISNACILVESRRPPL
jgi:predicted CoA-binding protein